MLDQRWRCAPPTASHPPLACIQPAATRPAGKASTNTIAHPPCCARSPLPPPPPCREREIDNVCGIPKPPQADLGGVGDLLASLTDSLAPAPAPQA